MVNVPFYQPRLPIGGGGGGVFQPRGGTPYKSSMGADIASALMQAATGYLGGQEQARTRGLDERSQAIMDALRQTQTGLVEKQTSMLGEPEPMTPLQQAQILLALARAGQIGKPTPQTPEARARTIAETKRTEAETGLVGRPSPKLPEDLALIRAKTQKALRPDVPTRSGLIAKEMMKLEPGSKEWKELAKIGAPTTTIHMPAASERTAIASSRSSIGALENLKTLFNKNYVGPLKGRVGKAKDIFGQNPMAQSQFYAATAAFKNLIIKQITGAQMSEQEADRIMKQVPSENDPPTVWQAKWEQSLKNVQRLLNEQIRILGETGIRTPTGTKTGRPQLNFEQLYKTIPSGIQYRAPDGSMRIKQ